MECSKENQHRDLGIVGVNVNFRALENQSESSNVLEKAWKFVSEKGYEPCKTTGNFLACPFSY